jgi:Rps23 Pro-64 3,4-dihydroxylase Tpa1-like proline 4-hydroxylase
MERWVHSRYLNGKTITALSRSYRSAMPFPHASLPNFLIDRKAKELLAALRRQQLERKESDLFCFFQSGDLLYAKDPAVRSFLSMWRSKEFIALMREITGQNLSGGIDAMCAVYKDTDYLLCHDDELEGRKVAYVLNLSEAFTARSGGALALLGSDRDGKPRDVAKRLIPAWNTLTLFTVSERSHHMVEEVLEDKERIALTGWLHG